MIVLAGRNVHSLVHHAATFLQRDPRLEMRDSRNGRVMAATEPVVSEYLRPWERVVLWPVRDANPFFHLAESLWMLAGRDDLGALTRYVKRMRAYSDDGGTLRGAYGRRWATLGPGGSNQLQIIIDRLRADRDDRRCVLQMWDGERDLGWAGKDVPCNLVATFQRRNSGHLDLTVFNRSNDAIWGAYGANAVHFTVLQEYMATQIGCDLGMFRQVSVNWHVYDATAHLWDGIADSPLVDPYERAIIRPLPMFHPHDTPTVRQVAEWQIVADAVLELTPRGEYIESEFTWLSMVSLLLCAHWRYQQGGPDRFDVARAMIQQIEWNWDWAVAALEWLDRREARAQARSVEV